MYSKITIRCPEGKSLRELADSVEKLLKSLNNPGDRDAEPCARWVVISPAEISIGAEQASGERVLDLRKVSYSLSTGKTGPSSFVAAQQTGAVQQSDQPNAITIETPSGSFAVKREGREKSIPEWTRRPEFAALEGILRRVDTSEGLCCRIESRSGHLVSCELDKRESQKAWKLGDQRVRVEGWALRAQDDSHIEKFEEVRCLERSLALSAKWEGIAPRLDLPENLRAERLIRELRNAR
jgi:hypothetical protein